jgi:DNA repair protein RecO (recombination protein O)
MRSVSDEAIMIGLMDYREADRIVTLYTREHGKIKGIARGARKSVKRFAGALELFARLTVRFIPNSGLATIQEVDIISIFPRIRLSLAGIAYAGYGCELVDGLTPEYFPNPRIFRLFESYLSHIDQSESAPDPSDRRFFEVNLLSIAGYSPPIDDCLSCGAPLAERGGVWNGTHAEGILCPLCAVSGICLGGDAIRILRSCLKTGRFGVIRFGDRSLAEAGEFLDAAIASCLPRTLNSLAFLRLSQ